MTRPATATPDASTVTAQKTRSPLYRFDAHLDVHPIGIVPEGLRMANAFEGEVTGGALAEAGFAGARVWGIDHFVLRRDGVGLIDAEKTISAGDRQLYEHVVGYCLPPEGVELPPLEALLEPGFVWPDLLSPIIGTSRFRCAVTELDYLNRAFATIEGWAHFPTGGLAVETSLAEYAGEVSGPARAA
jgi:hypothetical protein